MNSGGRNTVQEYASNRPRVESEPTPQHCVLFKVSILHEKQVHPRYSFENLLEKQEMTSIACVLLGTTVISLSFHWWSSDWESVIPAKNDGSLFEIFNFNYAYACVSVFQFVPINIGTCMDQKRALDSLEMKLKVLVIPFLWEPNSKEQWFFCLFVLIA